ncbi:dynamin family protein [Pseudoneobacillus rhizosphaerae]|uniref:Dynamin N-terminal domain-containing protein n=1 Tax=Pseudoneobacillus rhizosphaerae TaxID=2880968 RepID=A0A9C7G6T0_9BACI|nr:dynamin family protein [Pseudoneobacillus rhizosphaerae]CAG9606577.1 hypothetical protein NEOCIP111885_00265 [Pseudoneobacillus rhizosphaerae]
MSFEVFNNIALYLQNAQLVKQVEVLQKMNEKTAVYVPLIGQFSAGKSNLLNNLFGRKILPTMLSETTAFSTYISYGEEESAYLITVEGIRYPISLEQLLKLSQQTFSDQKSLTEILDIPISELDVDSIHVHIQHPLLQNGLVFVDTPGLNTLLQTHENRTQALLPQANAILYVLGKSLTDSDLTIIRQIDQLGIEMIFVRTRLDEVKSSEGEFVEDVLQKDHLQLKKWLGKEPKLLGVTNELDFLAYPEWKTRMNTLYQHLSHHLASQVEQVKATSIQTRLLLIATEMLQELEDRKHQLEELKQVDLIVLEERVQELERQISILEGKLATQFDRIHSQFTEVEKQIYSQLESGFHKTKKKFENSLQEQSSLQSLQEVGRQLSRTFIDEVTKEADRIVKDNVNQFFRGMTVESNELLADVERQVEGKQALSMKLTIDIPSIEDIFEDAAFLEEYFDQAEGNEDLQEQLQQLKEDREQLKVEMAIISQQKNEVDREKRTLGGYQSRYKQVRTSNIQEVLGKLGMGLDLALLFVPGTAVAKGAGLVAKGAGAISKSTKVIKIATDAAKIAEKATKTAKTIDKVKDALYMAKTVQEKIRNNEIAQKTPGLLDMVTVEFWFRKVGEVIDGPTKHVEDDEYRQQYQAVERELSAKYEAAKLEELTRLQQLNLINTKEERLKKEKEIEKRNQLRIQQEVQRERDHFMQETKRKQIESYRRQLVSQFEEAVDGLLHQQSEFVAQFLAELIEKLPTSLSMRLQQEITIYRDQLHKAIELKQMGEQEAQQKEQLLTEYIQFLKEYSLETYAVN